MVKLRVRRLRPTKLPEPRVDTTLYNHVAADLVAHARALSDAIAALDDR